MINTLLGMTLAGSAVFLIWSAIDKLQGGRLPARWHYRILKLSLLFMLVPVGKIFSLLGKLRPVPAPASVTPVQIPELPTVTPILPPGAAVAPVPEAAASPAVSLSADMFRLLAVLWAVGAAALLLHKAAAFYRFRRRVLRADQAVTSPEVMEIFQDCRTRLGVRTPVRVMENPLLQTSLTTGLLWPVIVLPAAPLPSQELRYLLLHELTHVKNRDLWVRFLSLAALALHWYNPLMHLLNRKIKDISEQTCDELVASPLSGGERYAYGSVLLKLASSAAYPGEWAASLSAKETLERRLIRVLHPKHLTRTQKFLSLALAAAILICGTAAALAARTPFVRQEAGDPVQTAQEENAALRALLSEQRESSAKESAVWFTPEDIHDIESIELVWWNGVVYTPSDPAAPAYLESLLSKASAITSAGCPYHSVLYLKRTDGVLGKVLPAEDSCAVFQSNGIYYDFGQGDNAEFYALFGVSTAELPHWTTSGAIQQLKSSITYQNDAFSFTIPAGSANWDIHISGRLETGGGMSVHYLDGESWTSGKTYTFQPADGAYTELTMDIALGSQDTSVDLTPYLLQKASAPSDKTEVLYPDALRGNTALILSRGGTLLPDDDPNSYQRMDGVWYKLFLTKSTIPEAYDPLPGGIVVEEYLVGNADAVPETDRDLLNELVDGEYPKNSRGESYGHLLIWKYVGYRPDLMDGYMGINGNSGYISEIDEANLPHNLPEDQCPHEFLIPLYDSEHNEIDKFPVGCGGHFTGMTIDEAKEAVVNAGLAENPSKEVDTTGMSVEEAKAALDSGFVGTDNTTSYDTEDRLREKLLVDGQYPTTADGKTYGPIGLIPHVHPDLVSVIAANGKSGYAKYEEFDPYGTLLSDPDTTPEELAAAKALLNDCVRTMIPVYDLEGNIVGEYETYAFPS